MKKRSNTFIIAIIITTVAGIVAGIVCLCPGIIFFWCMITDDGGKLDNVDKISAVVTENQETLQDIVSQVLSPEYDLDIVIDVEDKEFQALSSSKVSDEESFDLYDIYRLSEELEIKKIRVYKDSDVNIVMFHTYSSGIAGSSDQKGFFYLEGGVPEKLLEYNRFTVYRIYDYSEITDNWYYFDISY